MPTVTSSQHCHICTGSHVSYGDIVSAASQRGLLTKLEEADRSISELILDQICLCLQVLHMLHDP